MLNGTCQLDRYLISDLAARLNELGPDHESGEIEVVLEEKVNFPPSRDPRQSKDPLLKEHRGQFTSDNSISAVEAATFIRRMIEGKSGGSPIEAAISKGLENIYFGGSIFRNPAPHMVEVNTFHDGDTPTIRDSQDENCNTGAFATAKVRTSGIDAPEVGAAAYGKKRGWINPKLAENVDKVHAQISDGRWDTKKLPAKELAAISRIIAFTIDYTGQLSKMAVDGSVSWGRDASEKGRVLAVESQINWISSDTPQVLCGMWQPYDTFARRLVSFMDTEDGRLARYIREGLPAMMAENGAQIFEKYRSQVEGDLNILSGSKVAGLFKTAREMVEGAPDPAEIYSADNCEKMAAAFESLGDDASRDIQAMQIVIGSVYDYQKYRNQSGALYESAGEIARAEEFGFWTEISFRSLWDYNMRTNGERYDPPECP